MLLVSLYVLFWPDPASGGGRFPGADKVVHAGLFGLLALTSRCRFGTHGSVLAALVAYAVVSELVQAALLSNRSGDGWDVLADLAGVATGWWLAGRVLSDRPAAPGGGVRIGR